MKKGWKVEKLGDVVDFQRGLTYSKKDEVDYSSNIVLRATNVDLNTNTLDFSELKYINEKIIIPKEKKVRKGSLIICTASGSKSHLGKVALVEDKYDYAFGGFMGQITPRKILDSKFLFYSLTSEAYKKYIDELSDGININNLRFDALANFEIPIPPLPEQQRIVSVLDEAFESIARAKSNAERNLVNAREVFDSISKEIFDTDGKGWEEKRLGDKDIIEIIDNDRGVNYPKKSDFHTEGYCLFMNTKNVRPNGFDFTTNMFITEKKDKALGKGKLSRNDVVMTTRGTIGNLGIYNDKVPFEQIRTNSGMLIFRPNTKHIVPEFLFEVLRSGTIKSQTKKHVSGAAQPQLPIKTLVNFSFHLPKSLAEQHAIVTRLEGLSAETKRLEEIYERKVEALEELKKSVLSKAFGGEL